MQIWRKTIADLNISIAAPHILVQENNRDVQKTKKKKVEEFRPPACSSNSSTDYIQYVDHTYRIIHLGAKYMVQYSTSGHAAHPVTEVHRRPKGEHIRGKRFDVTELTVHTAVTVLRTLPRARTWEKCRSFFPQKIFSKPVVKATGSITCVAIHIESKIGGQLWSRSEVVRRSSPVLIHEPSCDHMSHNYCAMFTNRRHPRGQCLWFFYVYKVEC